MTSRSRLFALGPALDLLSTGKTHDLLTFGTIPVNVRFEVFFEEFKVGLGSARDVV